MFKKLRNTANRANAAYHRDLLQNNIVLYMTLITKQNHIGYGTVKMVPQFLRHQSLEQPPRFCGFSSVCQQFQEQTGYNKLWAIEEAGFNYKDELSGNITAKKLVVVPLETILHRPAPPGTRPAPFHGINRCTELSVAVNRGVAGFLRLKVEV